MKRGVSSDCAPTVTAERRSLLGPPGEEQGGGAGGREVEGGREGGERRARRSRRGEGLEELHFEARGGYR